MNARTRTTFGPILVVAGVVVFFLLLASRYGEAPRWLAARFIAHGPIWGLVATFLVIGGVWMQWGDIDPLKWVPALSGQRFRSLKIYTRRDCPLCNEAIELMKRYRQWLPSPEFVDVDQDQTLVRRFGESVPVIEIDGRIRFRGRVSELLLRRLIDGSSPSHS